MSFIKFAIVLLIVAKVRKHVDGKESVLKCDMGSSRLGTKRLSKCTLANVNISSTSAVELPQNVSASDVIELQVQFSQLGEEKEMKIYEGFKNLIRVKVDNCIFEGLKSFVNWRKFESIAVRNCNLKSIENCTFVEPQKIKNLLLVNNGIEDFDEMALTLFFSVNVIDLSFNRISCLHKDTFSRCELLKTLNLASNQLKGIPSSLFSNNKNLKRISFADNKIEEIEKYFLKEQKFLDNLNLTKNRCIDEHFSIKQSSQILLIYKKVQQCEPSVIREAAQFEPKPKHPEVVLSDSKPAIPSSSSISSRCITALAVSLFALSFILAICFLIQCRKCTKREEAVLATIEMELQSGNP